MCKYCFCVTLLLQHAYSRLTCTTCVGFAYAPCLHKLGMSATVLTEGAQTAEELFCK